MAGTDTGEGASSPVARRRASTAVTSRDVAETAGVSQTTVSRVLRGRTNVGAQTRERVLQALHTTGYSPNAIARAMITGKTGTVGIVVEDITNTFYPELLEALGRKLAAAGRRMILWHSAAGEASAIDAIRERLVDGVIFTTAVAESAPLQAAASQNAPVVLVNRVTAFGALNAARTLDVRMPGQLSVVGFDDIEMSSWPVFNLTTVRQPIPEMAQAAVRLLLQRIDDPARPFQHVELTSSLTVCGSADAPVSI